MSDTPAPTLNVVTPEGVIVSWIRACLVMEDDIADSLTSLYPCTEQEFFTAYCQAYERAHGRPFAGPQER